MRPCLLLVNPCFYGVAFRVPIHNKAYSSDTPLCRPWALISAPLTFTSLSKGLHNCEWLFQQWLISLDKQWPHTPGPFLWVSISPLDLISSLMPLSKKFLNILLSFSGSLQWQPWFKLPYVPLPEPKVPNFIYTFTNSTALGYKIQELFPSGFNFLQSQVHPTSYSFSKLLWRVSSISLCLIKYLFSLLFLNKNSAGYKKFKLTVSLSSVKLSLLFSGLSCCCWKVCCQHNGYWLPSSFFCWY